MHNQKTSRLVPHWQVALGVFALMFFAVLIAFGGSLFQNFHQIDDTYLVVNNLAIRGVTVDHLKTIFTTFDPELYVPLTLFTYQIDYMLGGLHAELFHLTNLLIHSGNAVLLAWLLYLLLGTGWPASRAKGWIAILCGLLFAIHPLNTEAVVWISGRKDLLSTFFFLGTCIGYVLYRHRVQYAYLLSIVLFLLALLSKVMVAPLPLVLLLADLLVERRKLSVAMLADKLPYIVLAGAFMVVAVAGKERVLAASTLLETALMAGRSTVFYAGKFALPVQLSVFYPHLGAITPSMPLFFVPALLVAASVGVAAWAWRRRTWLTFGILFFLVTLTPTFLNFQKGEVTFFAVDRYAYLPSIGLFFIIAVVCTMIADQWEKNMGSQRAQRLATQVGSVVCLVLVVLSMRQTGVWNDSQTLYEHALALYPESVSARSGLAAIYRQDGRQEDELKVMQDGLKYTPNDVSLLDGIGSVYAQQSKFDEALVKYEQAMRADPTNPEPYFYRGSLQSDRGQIDAAIRDYQHAIDMDPSYVAATNNLASIYMERNELDKALTYFNQALAYNPNFMEGQYNVGRILHAQGKLAEAETHLLTADELSPYTPDILAALAAIRIDQKRYDEALNYLRSALQIERKHPDALALLQSLIDQGIVGTQGQRMQ